MEYKIVDYKKEYAAELSDIIIRNLLEVNIKDYSLEKVKELSNSFTAEKVDGFSKQRKVFVAINNDKPIGLACAAKDNIGNDDDYVILTVFVSPDFHGKGIGAQLMNACEKHIKDQNGKKIRLHSSITSRKFYEKMGFNYTKSSAEPDDNGHIIMEKKI